MLNTDCKITGFEVMDIRFPTSKTLDGSDAMNPNPDYSAAYLILKTKCSGFGRPWFDIYNWPGKRYLCGSYQGIYAQGCREKIIGHNRTYGRILENL